MRILGLLLLALSGGPVMAEETVLKPGFEACVANSTASGKTGYNCASEAVALCTTFPSGQAEELECYLKAKSEWGALLTDFLEGFEDQPEKTREFVRIDVKYSLLSNLMQCDRHHELTVIGREADVADDAAKAQCQAYGTAATLLEAMKKSERIKR